MELIEETTRIAEVGALAFAVLGIVIVIYSVVRNRNILMMALGALITASALIAPKVLRAPPIDVLVVRGEDQKIKLVRKSTFYGGIYQTRRSKSLAIETKRLWGRTATMIINDSDRLVTVKAYPYSNLKPAGGRVQLLTFLLPGERQVFPQRISFAGEEAKGPPKTLTAEADHTQVLYLSYSNQALSEKDDKSIGAIEEKLEYPQKFPREKIE